MQHDLQIVAGLFNRRPLGPQLGKQRLAQAAGIIAGENHQRGLFHLGDQIQPFAPRRVVDKALQLLAGGQGFVIGLALCGPLGLLFVHSFLEPGHRALQGQPGAGQVDTLKAPAALAEDIPFVQIKAGVLLHQLFKLHMGHAQGPHIQPKQVSALQGEHANLGEMLFHKLGHIFCVALNDGQQLLQPVLALVVSRLAGPVGKNIQAHNHVRQVKAFGLGPDLRVRNEDIGALDAGQIEGLAGGGADGADLPGLLGNRGQHGVLIAGHNQVVVNLVVDDKDIVASADFHHLFQLFPAPNLAHRVMGVAEEQNLGVWAGSQLLQLLILDAVPAVFPLFQR